MGWRAHDAYDREPRKFLRSLPLPERYDWRLILVLVASSATGAALGLCWR